MAKHQVLVLGAGTIGSLITCMLAQSGDYKIHLCDIDVEAACKQLPTLANIETSHLDAKNPDELNAFIKLLRFDAIISCLPYYCNQVVAGISAAHDLHYFDLTEDVEVAHHVRKISEGKSCAFVPQCGLAPGFISIVANTLMEHFDKVETVKMRVGALPINPNNALKYSLTWSTDGLINEYGNICYGIENGTLTTLLPLEGYETISVDGLLYEAFNTSGGLGTLAETSAGKVKTMNYKTLRYPGHCEQIRLLMNDLKLNEDRATLKKILEQAVPKTMQDVVLIYVSVTGIQKNELFEKNYVTKIYPKHLFGKLWSAIQITTAAGLCSVADHVLNEPTRYQGFVTQETFSLDEILTNRFGKYYTKVAKS